MNIWTVLALCLVCFSIGALAGTNRVDVEPPAIIAFIIGVIILIVRITIYVNGF